MGVGLTYIRNAFNFKNKDGISTYINTECPLHVTKISILKIKSLSLKKKAIQINGALKHFWNFWISKP